MIKGFKIFNKDLSNRYGTKFEIDKIYVASGKIKWGNDGNGFHLCTKIEDTFRYYDAINNECVLAEVIGDGNYIEVNDEYYGYYDMYVVEILKITKILNRENIIKSLYDLLNKDIIDFNRIVRFISGYKLEENEIKKIIEILEKKDYYNLKNYLYYIRNYQNYHNEKKYIKL